jgi:flagellar biosynthesis protein FlhB
MPDKEQKTENPTGRRLSKEREKGNLFRNRDVVIAGLFLAEIMLLKSLLSEGYDRYKAYVQALFQQPVPADFTQEYVRELVNTILILVAKTVGPLMLLVVTLTFVGLFAQGGWNLTFEPLGFKLNRILPKNNFLKIFSKQGLIRLLKEALLFLIIINSSWGMITEVWAQLPAWGKVDPEISLVKALSFSYGLAWKVGMAYLVIAILIFLFEKYQFKTNLKMTKQEVKDEYKDQEGNPQIKGKIRSLQIQAARRRMMNAIPEATMVITNPTHYAVALKYDSKTMPAPTVVAKGKNLIAQKIKSLAQEHMIPIVENKPLAQLLYKKVEIGEVIPVELYRVVAEMLAYVMRLRETSYR